MKKTIVAALAAALMSSGAYAADILGRGDSLKDGPTAAHVSHSWTGIWLGAVGGMAFGNNQLNYDASYTEGGGEKSYSEQGGIEIDGLGDENSLFGEVQLGFDYQTGPVVIGVFGGLNAGNGEFKIGAGESDSQGYSSSAEVTLSQKWGGVIGPRLGFARDNTLLYVAGGWAFGEMEKIKGSLSVNGQTQSADLLPEQETDLTGWFGEIGMEHKYSDSISLKIAGRYTDYSKIDLFRDGKSGEGYSASERLTLDRDVLAVMGGIVFRPNIARPRLD
jgi:outer membrane immunogenic protein